MRLLILLFCSALFGCQYDPHAHLLTTSEPSREDVIGIYVVDRFDIPQDFVDKNKNIYLEIRRDGTFVAKNIPPEDPNEPNNRFSKRLLSGTGNWEVGTVGSLNGDQTIWGIYLRSPSAKFLSPSFTGKKPPYGLIFTLGDPDSGFAILMKSRPDINFEVRQDGLIEEAFIGIFEVEPFPWTQVDFESDLIALELG